MRVRNKEVGKVLFKGYRYKKGMDLISEKYELKEEEAYDVEEEVIEELSLKEGWSVRGYKVSMSRKGREGIGKSKEGGYGRVLCKEIVNDGG
ncbi:hypothetical protein [Staphylococcus epidermidis]|uniref:hypothetical protein n=1 Tax=Staphylococcus epidermidis TaxID=1282 RepID=UPI0011A1F93C|nr:hypothetical protein [Staphylococcus epidermidis]